MKTDTTSNIIYKQLLKPLINRLIYAHFWIAACALAMYWQTQWLLTNSISLSATAAFVFSSTLALYGLHRLISLYLIAGNSISYRFKTISRLNKEIGLYTSFALIAAVFSFLHLSPKIQTQLLLPGLVALLYILPLFAKKRLRDLPYIKIFLIALVWTWMTVWLPVVEQQALNRSTWIMAAERALFIFAITLPFDLRDKQADQKSGVKTLPSLFDVRPLGSTALIATIALAWINYNLNFYPIGASLSITLTSLLALLLLWLSPNITHDYFFSGLIDGLMILQAILVIVAS